MSNVHVCSLPQRDSSGLPKLPPNATFCKRMARRFRKLIIVDPNHYKCNSFSLNKSVIISEQRKHIKGPYRFMIHPFSRLCTIHELLFFAVWTYRMFLEPMVEIVLEIDTIRSKIDCVIYILQCILIVCFFFMGYVDNNTKEVVIDIKRVVLKYLKTFFLFDLVSTEVLHLIVYFIIYGYIYEKNSYWYIYKALGFMHLPCIYIRLNTILNYLNDIGRLMKLGKKVRKVILHALRTYMFLHLFACMLYLIPAVVYEEEYPNNSWLVAAKIDPGRGVSFSQIYGECLLMTMCFFFGASEKYTVYQTNEQISLSVVSIFGRLYTLFLIADVLRVFGIAGLSESNYERELAQMKEYMQANDLPFAVKNKMIRYFEYKFQKRFFNQVEIMNSLSGYLRTQIFSFLASTIIKKCVIFKHLPSADAAALFSLMKLETFTPGDFIYKAGQLIQHIYFISSGSIAVITKDGFELCHLEDGDMFGLCTMLVGREMHSCLALEATDVLLIEIDKFYEFLEAFPDALENMHKLAKERFLSFREQEHISKKEKGGCLDDLRTGRLLEKRRERSICQ